MNDNRIKCPNQKCGAENPSNAKFCRVCGQPIIVDDEGYTLDLFPDIELTPVSLKPIRFVTIMEKISYFMLPILIISLILICGDLKRDFIHEFRRDAHEITVSIGFVLVFIFAIVFIVGLRNCCKLIQYRINADYIEENIFIGETKRIAKRKKLGLFDTKKKRILLRTKYDKITTFDDQHLQLENNSKVGIYSIPLRKIIVPLQYEQVMIIKNGVLCGVKDSQLTHYDTRGNVLQ